MTRFPATRTFPVHGFDANPPIGLEGLFSLEPVQDLGKQNLDHVPHRHDFTEVLFVTQGTGTHYIDFQPYEASAPHVFFLPQGHVHHWDEDATIDGKLVLFRDELLFGPGGAADANLVPHLDSPRLNPTSSQRQRAERLLEALADECRAEGGAQLVILRTLLSALLLECARMNSQPSDTAVSNLSRQFSRLATAEISAQKTVESCAAQLGVTPGHLYDVITAETGRTPGEILRGNIVREAKRLLAGSDMSCAQVAQQLGFSSASYFSRFFVREAGMSPSEYRVHVLEAPAIPRYVA